MSVIPELTKRSTSLFAILALAVALFLLISDRYEQHRSFEQFRYEAAVSTKAETLSKGLFEMLADIKLISGAPVFGQCLQAGCNTSTMPSSFDAYLANFFNAYQHYTQFRVIDGNGMELVRWDYKASSKTLTRNAKLQDKSQRYYIKEAQNIAVGETYLSHIDHNIENGRLQVPLVPTVRAVHKIESGGVEAFLVLNRDVSSSIERTDALSFANANADADADTPSLRFIYPVNQADDSVVYASLFALSETANEQSLSLFSSLINSANALIPLAKAPIKQQTQDGFFIYKSQPFEGIHLAPSSKPLQIAAYIPRSYLINTFWKNNLTLVSFLLLIVTIIAALFMVLQSKTRRLQNTQEAQSNLIESLAESEKQVVKQAERQKEIFAIVSHELRTPLSSIKMMSDDMSLADTKPHGADIVTSVDSLLSILEDMRMVMDPQKTLNMPTVIDQPFALVERSLRALKSVTDPSGLKIHFSGDRLSNRSVSFHAQALRQIVSNLVKNAVLHSKGSDVWVDLQAEERSADQLSITVTVQDNGVGVSSSKQARMFDAFVRGDSDADGTGLGLHIINELVKLLGAKIQYFTSSQGGAGFKLEFEAHLASLSMQEDTPVEFSLEGFHILFVEDQITLQKLTCKQLELQGCRVLGVGDGVLAMEALKDQTFDIVLTDINMPNMNGYELTKRLRESGYNGLIIGVTAATVSEETEKLISLGANAVLPKPISMDRLKAVLSDLVIDR